MIKILKTIILLLIAQGLYAQKATVSSVDITTYNHYLKGEWEELISTGKESLNDGINFYYLQVRMGIAYYKLENYRKAINHFENAFKSSPTDAFVREYLYYSYLFAGRKSDAVVFSKRLTHDMRKKLKINNPNFIQGFQTEYGYFNNKDYSNQINTNYVGNIYEYAEQTVPENYKYFNIGLSHAFSGGTTFNHSYTNLKINKLQQYQTPQQQAQQQQNRAETYNYTYTTNQHQYFASFGFHPQTGLSINTAIHFLKTNSMFFDIDYDGINTPSLTATNYSSNEIVLHLSVAKEIGLISIGTSVSYSNLNEKNQFQPGVSLIYYPLGNLNLYTGLYLYYQSNTSSENTESSIIFNQKVGLKVKKIWFEGIATFGNFSEYNEAGGFIVYNSLDKIQNRFEGALIVPISNGKFNFSLRYQNLTYQGEVEQSEGNDIFNYTTFNYTNHSFIGGISWNF